MENKPHLKAQLAALALAFTAVVPSLRAQITIPNADGSDGALIITASTNIDLSQAGTGSWTTNSAKPGFGTYDPVQWAVVFKYSSISIASGATVSFLNNATHAPVVWLVNGNVTINGTLNLDGTAATSDPFSLPEPGPGGFRGGGSPTYGAGSGFGPGGGNINGNGTYYGSYGNPQIIPLIGGSGGGGSTINIANGTAGGGAILIAATGTITVNGYCHANGGGAGGYDGLGTGGAIRLVANQITGTGGTVAALGGNGNTGGYAGRIRLDANSVTGSISFNPVTQGVPVTNAPTIFPPANAPTVAVLSVQGLTAPTDPKASMNPNTGSDDLTLVTASAVTILLQTQNFPTNGTVTVYVKPRNSAQAILTASYVSGNTNSALWQVSTTLPYPDKHTVIQARATY